MATWRAFGLSLVWIVSMTVASGAQTWTESTDARSFPDGAAQPTQGGTSLDLISGSTGVDDLRDAYCIRIDDPEQFLATTDPLVRPAASSDFDVRLFLFRPDGFPVLANDDSSMATDQSTLTGSATDGSGFELMQARDYVLVVAGAPDLALNTFGAAVFDIDSNALAVHASRVPFGRFHHWSGGTPSTGSYSVALEGVSTCKDQLDLAFTGFDGFDPEPGRVCLGNGSEPGLDCQDISHLPFKHQPAVGYLNQDSLPDVVLGTAPDQVCFGNGRGGFASCQEIDSGPGNSSGAAVGYIDGDQHADVVFSKSYSNEEPPVRNRLCLGNGDGTFQPCTDVSSHVNRPFDSSLVYLDSDANLDIVFVGLDKNLVCFGDGSGGFSCQDGDDEFSPTRKAAIGDVNADGYLDAVYADLTDSRVCYGDITGGLDSCIEVEPAELAFFVAEAVELGYLNGDDRLDAVFAGDPSLVCLGDPSGLAFEPCLEFTFAEHRGVKLADVNNDGLLDAVMSSSMSLGSGRNQLCLGDGAGNLDCTEVEPVFGAAGVVILELGESRVFADGLESGDTTAWSDTSP